MGPPPPPELDGFAGAGVAQRVTLMKAPHHGSDDAVSDAFLRIASPQVVVISVGYGNTYGHPSPAALATYARYAAQVFRTDQDGPIMAEAYQDGSFEVTPGAR